MHYPTNSTRACIVCGKSFWGVTETCGPCEAITRAWIAKGFTDLCAYLEKVSGFEAYLETHQESGNDPAPAVDADPSE